MNMENEEIDEAKMYYDMDPNKSWAPKKKMFQKAINNFHLLEYFIHGGVYEVAGPIMWEYVKNKINADEVKAYYCIYKLIQKEPGKVHPLIWEKLFKICFYQMDMYWCLLKMCKMYASLDWFWSVNE